MIRTLFLASAVLASVAAPASAATIVQNFSGSGSYSVNKFDPTLGTLNAITAEVTGGSVTYEIALNGPLDASVPYTGTAYFGIYLGPLTIDGNVQGSGSANFASGVATIILPVVPYVRNIPVPTDPSSIPYNVLIGAGSTFASVTVDPPYSLSMPSLASYGRGINSVTVSTRSALWQVTYDYTPFGASVPEPSTWMLMIGGLGLVGASMRRRKSVISYA